MGKQSKRDLIVHLPLVLVATFLVVGVPMLLVFWLRKSGVVTSVWATTAIGVAVSLLASYAGGAFWKKRTDSRDMLFSDLMLWGWVQRWRSERRLSAAADLLGLTTGRPQAISGGRLTNEQKAGLLTQLTSGLEARDPYTHGHSRRVARHASNIAKRMGLPRDEVAKIRAAGAMHDVGKVETPITVLHKEGKLTDDEYAIIKRHPVDGATMVSTLRDDELTAMVRHHHERLDGTGYPDRLAGEAIPIGARILAVADTFDAITSTRPYRHAHAHSKALDILAADAGTQLDPDAVRAFCSCYSGRRPLAYWTVLANARPRLASWLGSGLAPAKAATMANVMVAAATVAAVGGAVAGPVAGVGASPSSSDARPRPQSPASLAHRAAGPKPGRLPRSGARPGRDSGREKAGGRRQRKGRAQKGVQAQEQRPASAQRPGPGQHPGPGQPPRPEQLPGPEQHPGPGQRPGPERCSAFRQEPRQGQGERQRRARATVRATATDRARATAKRRTRATQRARTGDQTRAAGRATARTPEPRSHQDAHPPRARGMVTAAPRRTRTDAAAAGVDWAGGQGTAAGKAPVVLTAL
ncbi:MAG: HD domain-containing phosphohydrolase [Thermoleophilaceae bacterium]